MEDDFTDYYKWQQRAGQWQLANAGQGDMGQGAGLNSGAVGIMGTRRGEVLAGVKSQGRWRHRPRLCLRVAQRLWRWALYTW